jgi:hypothetical protein
LKECWNRARNSHWAISMRALAVLVNNVLIYLQKKWKHVIKVFCVQIVAHCVPTCCGCTDPIENKDR